jgi:uncharacterized OB-fold protein
MTTDSPILSAPYVLEYPYHRSTGPVIGRFLAGLRDGVVLGARTRDGRVIVPPLDADPSSGETIEDLVQVGDAGVVTSWTWIAEPRPNHPLQRPFAFALIKLDGADTSMLHVVAAPDESAMRSGMRVRLVWRNERSGSILDIAHFEPDGASLRARPTADPHPSDSDPVTQIVTPVRLDFIVNPGAATTRFLNAISQRRIVGQRCPSCRKVYVPPRGSCPTCTVASVEEVELGQRGTVTSFCIVRVPYPGQTIRPPYCSASILLDGADIPFLHLVSEIPVEDVRMGLRVEAAWVPDEERGPTVESIRWFRPTGEPDVPYDQFKEHLV